MADTGLREALRDAVTDAFNGLQSTRRMYGDESKAIVDAVLGVLAERVELGEWDMSNQ